MSTSGGVMVSKLDQTSKPTRVSSSVIGYPIHSALCHNEAKELQITFIYEKNMYVDM